MNMLRYYIRRAWGYPVWRPSDIDPVARLLERGDEDGAARLMAATATWQPHWRRRDGSLRLVGKTG